MKQMYNQVLSSIAQYSKDNPVPGHQGVALQLIWVLELQTYRINLNALVIENTNFNGTMSPKGYYKSGEVFIGVYALKIVLNIRFKNVRFSTPGYGGTC